MLHVVQRDDARRERWDAQGEWVVDDVRAAQPAPQRPGPRHCRRHRNKPLRSGPRAPVLTRRLRRQTLGRAGSDGREQYAVGELAHASEAAKKLAHVRLAATELAGHEREK